MHGWTKLCRTLSCTLAPYILCGTGPNLVIIASTSSALGAMIFSFHSELKCPTPHYKYITDVRQMGNRLCLTWMLSFTYSCLSRVGRLEGEVSGYLDSVSLRINSQSFHQPRGCQLLVRDWSESQMVSQRLNATVLRIQVQGYSKWAMLPPLSVSRVERCQSSAKQAALYRIVMWRQ